MAPTKLHGITYPCKDFKEPSAVAFATPPKFKTVRMVGQAGLEPATPRLSSACSNQLSYRPFWWSRGDSNS